MKTIKSITQYKLVLSGIRTCSTLVCTKAHYQRSA